MSGAHQTINELNEKAWSLRYINRDEAHKFATEALSEAEKIKDEVNAAYANLSIAQLGFWKTSESKYLKEALEALTSFEKTNEALGTSRAHFICAGMFDQYGQYEKAMQHALLAVKKSETVNNDENAGDCYTALGQIYSRINDHTNAIEALKKGLDCRKQLKDDKAIASSLNLIARSYVLDKKYQEAEKFYNESLALRNSIGDTAGIPWTYLGIASLYSHKGEWKNSLDFYEKAEKANTLKEARFDLLCFIGKGKIHIELEDITQAIPTLEKALDSADRLKIVSLKAEAHELLGLAFEKSNEFPKALFHYKSFNALKQEILSDEKVNMLKHQQIAFSVESAEKEAEIHRLKNVGLKNAFDTIAAQHHELEEKSKEISDSINYAKRIQDAYLPAKELFNQLFPEAFLLFKPKDIVSGDFYWYAEVGSKDSPKLSTKDSRLETRDSRLFAAADCTGHGVPGAIMSVICCNALNEVVNKKNIHQPDLILNEVRNIVTAAFKKQGIVTQKDGMDISLVRLITNGKETKLQYAGANNPLWIFRKTESNNQLIEIKADKQPIGNYEVMNPFTLHEMDLQKGDSLYSFSDGYADQFGGEHGKKLKSKPLKDLLLSIQDHNMEEQHTLLDKAYNDWKREYEQIDDVCMIGVRV
jgi:serine phosphatase RsbU (regulator of sigma subunit)